MRLLNLAILAGLCCCLIGVGTDAQRKKMEPNQTIYGGREFRAVTDIKGFAKQPGVDGQETVLLSPEVAFGVTGNELVVSWNVEGLEKAGLKVEARAVYPDKKTAFYTLGRWSKEGAGFPRESVKGQKDADGDVATDTLVLNRPARRVQLRLTLKRAAESGTPHIKFLGLSLTDTGTTRVEQAPNRAVWGKEITVPGRAQSGWPDASGWCSPTSTSMALAFWSDRLKRPELDVPVPAAAHAIYDKVYDGTGNWPFNTAFAGAFPGMRAYVTRFADVRELEDWIAAGIPPVVSVSYDLLRGRPRGNDPGHLMVCDGFTREGDIVLNDPAHHPERGELARRVFPRAHFVRAWKHSQNTVYLIYPESYSGTGKLPANTHRHWE